MILARSSKPRLRGTGYRPANTDPPEPEGALAPLVVDAGAARAQTDRNRHEPVRRLFRVGENPNPRCRALDPSSDPQASGSPHRGLVQSPTRARASTAQ